MCGKKQPFQAFCCRQKSNLLARKPLLVSLMEECPEVEIACLRIRGGMYAARKS